MNIKKICLTKNPEVIIFTEWETEIYNDRVFNKIITRNPTTNEIKIYDPDNKVKLNKSESEKLWFNKDIDVYSLTNWIISQIAANFKDNIEFREISNWQVLIFKEKVTRKLWDQWSVEDINGNQYSKTIRKKINAKPEIYIVDWKLYKINDDIGDDNNWKLKYLEQLVFSWEIGNDIHFMKNPIYSWIRDMYLYAFDNKLFYSYSWYWDWWTWIVDSEWKILREWVKLDRKKYSFWSEFVAVSWFKIWNQDLIRVIWNNLDQWDEWNIFKWIINWKWEYIIPFEYNRLSSSSDGIFIANKLHSDIKRKTDNFIIELNEDLTWIKSVEPIEFLDKNNAPIEFKILPHTTIINWLITTKNLHWDRIVLDIKTKREVVPLLLDTYLQESTLLDDWTTIWKSWKVDNNSMNKTEYIWLPNWENLLDIWDNQKLNIQLSWYVGDLDKTTALSINKWYIAWKIWKVWLGKNEKWILIITKWCFSQIWEVTKWNLNFIKLNWNLYNSNNFSYWNIKNRKIVSSERDDTIEINWRKFKKKLVKLQ